MKPWGAASHLAFIEFVAIRYGGALMSPRRSYGHFTTGGIDDRIESTLPPVFRGGGRDVRGVGTAR